MKPILKLTLVLLLLWFVFCAHATEITIFAAASLTESLKEIAAIYEKQSGDKIIFNFRAFP